MSGSNTDNRFDDEEEELVPIVKYGHERPDLDYKASVSWDELPKRNKAELIRDMIALANSDVPGYIVIGASDDGGVVRSYDGLSDQQVESFDPSKIAEKSKRYADPEIRFDLYKPIVDGKRYVVIRVSPFECLPHICRTNYDDVLEEAAIYVRGEGARTMKIASAEYMRRIIDRAIQISADTLVNRIRKLLSASKNVQPEALLHFESQIADVRKQMGRKDV
jgi:predicted HTH transcriptional regulator